MNSQLIDMVGLQRTIDQAICLLHRVPKSDKGNLSKLIKDYRTKQRGLSMTLNEREKMHFIYIATQKSVKDSSMLEEVLTTIS